MKPGMAGLAAVILAAGVAVALPASLIIIALKHAAATAGFEIIAVASALAGPAAGAVCGYLPPRLIDTR